MDDPIEVVFIRTVLWELQPWRFKDAIRQVFEGAYCSCFVEKLYRTDGITYFPHPVRLCAFNHDNQIVCVAIKGTLDQAETRSAQWEKLPHFKLWVMTNSGVYGQGMEKERAIESYKEDMLSKLGVVVEERR